MVDQVYYKIQYPLKKAIDLMKDIDNCEAGDISQSLSDYEVEAIEDFINNWNNEGKEKLVSLISQLRASK
ncbi:hypothetical protein [Halanaerobium salsuginis]|jgi:hypothetical protein|uniref:Uncharacterized protein n=1 Tax=Halanaerobium salsuginis TaxID=29563 RepID=A0A1I4G8W9_9FIRM|nr:hypothetical protein [Halanaerobium salsuginis]SFL26502.1 hypothetical protein SAMN02983006_00661 [Halanaerobium salsuginis]